MSELRVDTTGLRCPEPLMKLYAALNSIEGGQSLFFIGDDPASWRDVHKMCNYLGHKIIFAEQHEHQAFTIRIKKKQC